MGFTVRDKVVVVTGAAGGIGKALAQRFVRDGAKAVVLTDLDGDGARRAADEVAGPAIGLELDVTDAAAVAALVDRVEAEHGPIDLYCSNAGVALGAGLGDAADWATSWQVHVLAHVHVADVLLPRMAERGAGQLVITASAAGLLTNMDSAPYSVTKHGSVALAEWLNIRYRGHGVGVSCLCPQAVRTAMTASEGDDSATLAAGGMLEPEDVAESVTAALAQDRFLILPHPEVAEFEVRRAGDRDRWLRGMASVFARLRG